MANKIDLNGRFAVVTGGAQGIGRAIVERFLDFGAAVAIWDRDEPLSAKTVQELAARGRVIAFAADVSDNRAVEQARDAMLSAFNRIDILVNNAGIGGPTSSTWDYPIDAWREVMAVTLDGSFYCCRAVVPQMIANNYGRIVNIASVAGKEGNPRAPAYSASKAGLISLTKSCTNFCIERVGGLTWMSRIRAGTGRITGSTNSGSTSNCPRRTSSNL